MKESPSVIIFLDNDYKRFCVDSFCIYLKLRTLARHEIFANYPEKHFFALFDFDDAYNDWRELGGKNMVTDIELGLCRKLDGKNAYTFLLPVPDNNLRAQVWDESNPNEKIKPKPHFCIEHIFWQVSGLDKWFRVDNKSSLVKFKGDKVKFAKEDVPKLSAACFEVFRPMFEFIRSECLTNSKEKTVES